MSVSSLDNVPVLFTIGETIASVSLLRMFPKFCDVATCCVDSVSRLTVVSREAKKKQHACASSGPRDHYSELFTRMAALKF